MTEGVTEIKKPFLSGTTRRIRFTIIDKATGIGFQPGTLLMSVYDVNTKLNRRWSPTFTVTPPLPTPEILTVSIVNAQQNVDVIAFVDSDGRVDLELTVDDTTIGTPPDMFAIPYQRYVTFVWTWASPAKTAKQVVILNIMPDWAVAAA